ncbi:hypothetical protein PPERSA_06715 [Pseudocohnilembus persalinus]|uniref:C2H2-type domain-containing protein n=1 Tax=Pseudocohnilembus persalinus TaxID=266149 RepID=A0A0V0QS19_PSEPJ|nr:hypothetical protein PPERSA_06715 [Pseudocohnilembus persalinus]|eukprot:KRX05081.1 hypothetical protein PPERSA_06715 [Pseudocohnilembus persalinus]
MSTKIMNGILSTDVSCNQNQSNSQSIEKNDSNSSKKESVINKQNSNKIQCPYCTKLYKQKYILNTHIKSVHRKNPHHCAECQESYSTIQEYKDHICKALHPELITEKKGSQEIKNSKILEKIQESQEKTKQQNIQSLQEITETFQQIHPNLAKTKLKEQENQKEKLNKINQNPSQQINDEILQKIRNQQTSSTNLVLNKNNLQQQSQIKPQPLKQSPLIIFPQSQLLQSQSAQVPYNTNKINSTNVVYNDDSASFLQESIHQTQLLKGFTLNSNEEESSQTQLVQNLDEEKRNNVIQAQKNTVVHYQQQQQQLQSSILNLQQQMKNQQQFEALQSNLVQQLLQKQQENLILSQLLQKQQQIGQFNVFGLTLGANQNQNNFFQQHQQHQFFQFQKPQQLPLSQQNGLVYGAPSFNSNFNAIKFF